MQNEMRDRLIEEPNYCDYCFNFDKEHIGMDGTAVCKLTNKIVYSEDGGDCPFFNVPKERIIVPPCKVGDTVYYNLGKNASLPFGTKRTLALEAEAIASTKDKKDWFVRTTFAGAIGDINFSDFGKTVFLTKEETEKALKKALKEREIND